MKTYYYSDGLSNYGPFSVDELRGKQLEPRTMVRESSMENWKYAEQFPELEGSLGSGPVPSGVAEKMSSGAVNNRLIPKSWLLESILVTIFCCLPFGIVGIVNAARVEAKYASGNYESALKSSKAAGTWTKLGFWLGLSGYLIYFVFVALAIATGSL